MPRRVALLIAATLVLLAPTAASAQVPAADEPPAIAAIADLHTGPEPIPIVAVWRDESPTNRYHLITSEGTDLDDWAIRMSTIGWQPDPIRVTMMTNDGVPSSAIATLNGTEATPSGTAATAIEEEGVAIDVPGRPTNSGGMHVRSVQREEAGTAQVALAPIDVNQLTGIPYGGLRTPSLAVTLDADGAPTTSAGLLPSGPAVTRTGTGIRITVVDAPPTALGAIPVTSTVDEVVMRTTDDLRAPRALSLVIGTDGVTARDAAGTTVAIDGKPWTARLTLNVSTGSSEVELTLLELASLVGDTVDEGSRFGVTRVVQLDDGTSVLADGLDVRYRDLRAGRAEVDNTAAEAAADSSRQATLLVGAGLVAMLLVLGPLVRFSLQARRERRRQPGA